MPKPTPIEISPGQVKDLAAQVIKKDRFPMLSTMDGDQPRVRPVSPVMVDGFTIYIANLRSYSKTAQIELNPKVELCYLDEDHNQVRITGVAETVNDRDLIEQIWQKNRLLKHYLGSVDNPELVIYRIVPLKVQYMQEWALKYWEVEI